MYLPYGMGPWGWMTAPYPHWGWGRCRWFPWLPRWWWTGMYGQPTPYPMPTMSKEDEMTALEEEAKMLERELERIKKRVEELRK